MTRWSSARWLDTAIVLFVIGGMFFVIAGSVVSSSAKSLLTPGRYVDDSSVFPTLGAIWAISFFGYSFVGSALIPCAFGAIRYHHELAVMRSYKDQSTGATQTYQDYR